MHYERRFADYLLELPRARDVVHPARVPSMDKQEALALVKRSLPKFTKAGLPPLSADAIAAVQPKRIASLWAGMGNVWQVPPAPLCSLELQRSQTAALPR